MLDTNRIKIVILENSNFYVSLLLVMLVQGSGKYKYQDPV
jgi:hypothetical protein